jgi:solute carrier family 41
MICQSFVQVQAIVVGLLAAIFAMMLGWIPQRKFNISEGLLLCASSVITASLASFILGISNLSDVRISLIISVLNHLY